MSIIRSIHNPEILLQDLQIDKSSMYAMNKEDAESGSSVVNKGEDFSKSTGLKTFFINVNGMNLDPAAVELCTVDCTQRYPTITLRFKPNVGEFLNFALPKDGDILSIFYRSTLDELKPLRMDFIITDLRAEADGSFVIFGVINIPNLFKDSSFVCDGTTIDTYKKLSKELKLGYATNEVSTDDKQKWLCANEPLDTFLQDIKYHAWKNERSFYDAYIDNYYMLNFINVFDQLNNEKKKKVQLGIYKFRQFIQTNDESLFKTNEDDIVYDTPLILHNWKYSTSLESSIRDIRITNTSSRISLEEGYQKMLHFYDFNLHEKIELLNESLTSIGVSEDYAPFKSGVFDESWRTNTRHNWGGIAYSLPVHNTHKYYHKAKAHNHQNLKEIDKFTIEVSLKEVNFNLIRYMIIPVLWYEYGEIARKLREKGKKFNSVDDGVHIKRDIPYILNGFISGFYVLKGFYIDFTGPSIGNPPIISQRVVLTRTEYPKNIIVTDADNKVVTNMNK